jgi:hypothetical protein
LISKLASERTANFANVGIGTLVDAGIMPPTRKTFHQRAAPGDRLLLSWLKAVPISLHMPVGTRLVTRQRKASAVAELSEKRIGLPRYATAEAIPPLESIRRWSDRAFRSPRRSRGGEWRVVFSSNALGVLHPVLGEHEHWI